MSASHYIPKDFFDAEYLYAYAEDFLNTKIATQIRVLREQRGLTQEELAKRIGTKQPGIARLENVNYCAWKVETLKKLARAFDVVFIGGFVSLSTLLHEAERFGRRALEQPSFKDEITEQERNTAKGGSRILANSHIDMEQWGQMKAQIFVQQMNPQPPSTRNHTGTVAVNIPSIIQIVHMVPMVASGHKTTFVQVPVLEMENGINLSNTGAVDMSLRPAA